jgi:PAS domain S-box-containing protein
MRTQTKRVLVVEDSPAQAALVTDDLARAGFAVTHAPDGESALACAEEREFDVVLSDVVMPGIDGYELCRQLKQRDQNLPVVLLTSLDDPIEIVHGLDAGADNFLRKPYDPAQLVARLETMLHHRAMRGSGKASMGLEVMLRDKQFLITAERQQILDLLMSSFEDLVVSNRELRERQEALQLAEAKVREQLTATERERKRLEGVLGASPTPMVIVEPDGTITEVSDTMCEVLGRSREELIGADGRDVFLYVDAAGEPLAPSLDALIDVVSDGGTIELGTGFDVYLRTPTAHMPVIVNAAAVRADDGTTVALVGSIAEIGTLSAHDSVTKLPHQGLFADHVARAARATAATDGLVAVLALTLEGWGMLAERLHPADVEALLVSVADRLRAAIVDPVVATPLGSLGYFGHDTFAVVLDGVFDELDALRRAQRVIELLASEPFAMGDERLAVGVAAGLSVDEVGTDDPLGLVAAAVAAARRAGASGSGLEISDPAVDARTGDWLRRQSELRTAIEQEQLVVHYQPELDLHSEMVWGVEALVRWEHPERGLLPPSEFLPLAEESGLIGPIGWWVLRTACAQAAQWRRSGLPGAADLKVSVNLDASQLVDGDVADKVSEILVETGLDPDALVLEVTESGVLDDADRAAAQLRSIRALGVRTAIDDFGTGYSSLVQLRRLPIDFLKVDRSFVDGMTDEPEDATIVAATIRLARALGIDSIAEGVETEEQLSQLRLLDCDFAQGFRWSRPLPPDELTAWWSTWAPSGVRTDDRGERGEATASVDDVLAYLVHELRSPLAVIAGYVGLGLEDESQDATILDPIRRAADELDHRIATLSDSREASIGAMRVDLADVDVVPLVDFLVADLAPQLGGRPMAVRTDGDGLVVRADARRLVQALTNLLVNADRYSPAGRPIELELGRSGGMGTIAVRDHGPGVPEDRRPELFRRFARLGARGAGTGVGLHLVRMIARAHGGDVRYEPAAGGGARFTITVPLK